MDARKRHVREDPAKKRPAGPVAGRIEPEGQTPFDKQGWFDMIIDRGFAAKMSLSAMRVRDYLLRRIYRTNTEGRWAVAVVRIAATMGLSERSVQKGLRELEALGLVRTRRRYTQQGDQTTSEYQLVTPPQTLFEEAGVVNGGSPPPEQPFSTPRTVVHHPPNDRSPITLPLTPLPCTQKRTPSLADAPDAGGEQLEKAKRLAIIDDALDRIGWRNWSDRMERRMLTREDVQLTFDAFTEYQQSLRRGGVKDRAGLFGSIFRRLRKQRGYCD